MPVMPHGQRKPQAEPTRERPRDGALAMASTAGGAAAIVAAAARLKLR
jgi:hypothetical protein